MAIAGKHGLWTVSIEDKTIIKKTGEFGISDCRGYTIEDDDFWNQSKWDDIHVIHFSDDDTDNDSVEFTDNRENGPYTEALYGNFRTQFITRWDAAHLAQLQADWDNDVEQVEDPADSGTYRDETEAEQIARKGARPTSYTSQ